MDISACVSAYVSYLVLRTYLVLSCVGGEPDWAYDIDRDNFSCRGKCFWDTV